MLHIDWDLYNYMQIFLKMKAGNIPMPPLRIVAIISSNLLTYHSRKPEDLCKSAFLFCLLHSWYHVYFPITEFCTLICKAPCLQEQLKWKQKQKIFPPCSPEQSIVYDTLPNHKLGRVAFLKISISCCKHFWCSQRIKKKKINKNQKKKKNWYGILSKIN